MTILDGSMKGHYDVRCDSCGHVGMVFRPVVADEVEPGVVWETGSMTCEKCGKQERHSRVKDNSESTSNSVLRR